MTTPFIRREGFWRDSADSILPIPRTKAKPWPGHQRFLDKLKDKEEDAATLCTSYRGWSTCRICNKGNGCSQYSSDGWTWPSGFRHYVEVHLVRPSLAFEEFIIGEHLK